MNVPVALCKPAIRGFKNTFPYSDIKQRINPWLSIRKRTLPAEQQPVVHEVRVNVCGQRDVAWSAQRTPTAINLGFLDRSHYLFI
jgi:hypothetical protein